MDEPNQRWRPKRVVRPLAIGLVRRKSELLVMAVRDDGGAIKGWRPVGGEIEFGETASAALAREFLEELGEPINEPELVAVLENIFEHHGETGHELVFAFNCGFRHATAYLKDRYDFFDGMRVELAQWVEVERFKSPAEPLYPEGLAQRLR